MENASKALLMAGGVMLTILVISVLLYAWTSYSEYVASQDELERTQELTKFNLQFTEYNRDDVQGYELLSLVNKVIDYNQRFSEEFKTSSAAGNRDQYTTITLNIKLDKSSGDYTNRNKFTTSITVPAVANSTHQDKIYDDINANSSYRDLAEIKYEGTDYRLFTDNIYNQSITSNEFANILSEIRTIEGYFKGATNAQDLVKSRSTIYESKIINYNGQPSYDYDRKNWYQKTYIISRYKTLTGIEATSVRNDIRNKDNVIKVLQYYEYIEFKKAEFKCTRIDYDDNESGESNTGRVIEMDFEIVS